MEGYRIGFGGVIGHPRRFFPLVVWRKERIKKRLGRWGHSVAVVWYEAKCVVVAGQAQAGLPTPNREMVPHQFPLFSPLNSAISSEYLWIILCFLICPQLLIHALTPMYLSARSGQSWIRERHIMNKSFHHFSCKSYMAQRHPRSSVLIPTPSRVRNSPHPRLRRVDVARCGP